MEKEELKSGIKDLYLASALLAYKANLEHIDTRDPKCHKFYFTGTVKNVFVSDERAAAQCVPEVTIEEFRMFYVSGKLLFPSSYPDAIRHIKFSIHSRD